MGTLKTMLKLGLVVLSLLSIGAISECRAHDEDYVEMNLSLGGAGMSYTPQWTPDGERIIVSYNEKLLSIDAGTGQVEIISQKTRNPSDILQIDYSPSVSPDGTRIAFTTHRFVTDGHYSWDIAMLEFDETGELRRTTEQLGPLTLSLDGGAIQLTHSIAEDKNPIWSPDGSRIAFVSDREDVRPRRDELYVMSSDGSNIIRVAPEVAVSSKSFAWSPDAKKLAFTGTRRTPQRILPDVTYTDTFSLYIARADGSGIEMIWEDLEHPIILAWSPDGSQLAIAIDGEGVFIADTIQWTPPKLIHDLGNKTTQGLFWTPTGDEVLYDAGGSLWSSTTDGRSTHKLWEWGDLEVQFGGHSLAMSMSPDGLQIAMYSLYYGEYGVDVTLIGLDGSVKSLIEESDWPDLSEFWTIY